MSAGDSPAILLVHGFAQTPHSWQTVIAALPDRWHVQAIELPGHGETALTRGTPSVETARAWLLQEADRLGVPAAVWGYSQGARVALDFAIHHGDRVQALVIESGTAGIEDPIARADRRSRDAALASRIKDGGIDAFVELWEKIPALSGQSRELIAMQREDRLSHDAAALAAALRGIGQAAYEPMWDRLNEIVAPTLLMTGTRDVLYATHAARMAGLIPNAELAQVEGAGHAVHLEQPVASAGMVVDFLSPLID